MLQDSAFFALQVMVIEVVSIEEKLKQMAEAIEKLKNTIEEKDTKIASLMSQLEIQHGNDSNKGPHGDEKDTFGGSSSKQQGESNSILASWSVQQLQDMIVDVVKAQYSGLPQDTLTYSKLYTKRLDNIRMPTKYQPPKFQQFDGKGNPKQYIAHFIETCNSARPNGDYLVKQFARSLRGTAFEWFT